MLLSRRRFLALAGVACLAGFAGLPGCGQSGGQASSQSAEGLPQRSFLAFDTICAVGGALDTALMDEAEQRCREFEQLFSATIDSSDVSRINAAGGKPVTVAPATADLIAKALHYSELSGGLFDITIGAVSTLWDFKEGVVPSAESIARALPHVDYRAVRREGDAVTLDDPDARIDLGGIAKGYIADALIARFKEQGVQSAFVNLGGNVKVLGAKPDGSPWNIGVRNPDSAAGGVVATVESTGGSLVTSGLYERAFEKDGRRYWHILDPRTGYPVESEVVSASVYSPESLDGDGLTKPLFMMEAQDALDFVAAQGGLHALLVKADGSMLSTPGATFAPASV